MPPVLAKPIKPFTLPDGQMILPGISLPAEWRARQAYNDNKALRAFLELIPKEIRLELARYSSRRWHLLAMFARCPGAMDLSRSNPALLYALASNWVFHKPAVTQPVRAARRLVLNKQRIIQEWLGFPATEPARRILSKLAPCDIDIKLLIYLRETLRDPDYLKMLSHLPRFPPAVAMLATDRRTRHYVTPRLLREAVENPTSHPDFGPHCLFPDIYRLVWDIDQMARMFNLEIRGRKIYSLRQAWVMHERLVYRSGNRRPLFNDGLPERFGKPPFKGTEHIIPLTTPEALFQEGDVQKNCIFSHSWFVCNGNEYIYRVLNPVRATLSVIFKNGSWEPDEIYMAGNQPVEENIRREVLASLLATREPDNETRGVAETDEAVYACEPNDEPF